MAGSPLLRRIHNRAERVRQHRWRVAPYRSAERHIVMGGAPRSGTTLLRTLLDRHPEVCSGPETKLLVPAAFNLAWLSQAYGIPQAELEILRREARSQGAFVDAFATRVRAAAGKARWAEKTPQNIRHLRWILERFPEALVVHIVRDGRDVVCSMREHPDWRWVDGSWQKVLVPRPLAWYAQRWVEDTAAGMAWRGDGRYVEVRYEDLVADPTAALRSVCERAGIPADATWLAQAAAGAGRGSASARPQGRPEYGGAVSTVSVGRWRTDLSSAEREEVERRCGERLRELGYGD
jgi:hypothetical protein